MAYTNGTDLTIGDIMTMFTKPNIGSQGI